MRKPDGCYVWAHTQQVTILPPRWLEWQEKAKRYKLENCLRVLDLPVTQERTRMGAMPLSSPLHGVCFCSHQGDWRLALEH